MSRERRQCQGVFRGLVVGRKNQNGGPYPAIENGECKVIEYVEQSNIPELIILEREIINAFIQANICHFDSGEEIKKYIDIQESDE